MLFFAFLGALSAYSIAMNSLFSAVFILSTILLLIHSPEKFLSTMLEGGAKAATLCAALVGTYSVWMGIMRVWEDCGLSKSVSKLLTPLSKRLFKTTDEQTLTAITMNLSVNMLGISGAATPYGIQAAKRLDKTEHAEFSSAMFFVLNATSLQIFPSSMIAVRVACGSANPTDIIIPTILTTLFSTLLGGILTYIFLRPKRQKIRKMQGAGTR